MECWNSGFCGVADWLSYVFVLRSTINDQPSPGLTVIIRSICVISVPLL